MPGGRRDGTVSKVEDVNLTNLPSPRANATNLIQLFESKGMTLAQMVVLSGMWIFTHIQFALMIQVEYSIKAN